MIEGALVHILHATPPHAFIGCGAVIEGGLIATCRHVWRDATHGAADGALPYADFPRSEADRRQALTLVHACDQETRPPDLVLLRPEALPLGTPVLQLAMHDLLETGPAACRARLRRSGPQWAEVTIRGTLDAALDPDGRRQFSGQAPNGYWFARGSSGSPLFKEGGQQLAAILSLSELGADEEGRGPHEAFVIPGTLIRRYAIRLAVARVAQDEGIDPSDLADIVSPSNVGVDIAAVIGSARDKLQRMDVTGAREVIAAKIAEEMAAHRRRIMPLLREQLELDRLGYDYSAAIRTLEGILALDPHSVWDWIALGDIHRTVGASGAARDALTRARDLALEQDRQGRDVAAACDRLGLVLLAQGDAPGALAEYRKAMAVAARLAASDPGHAEWQRDLSVSHNRIGDVLLGQGDAPAALSEYRKGVAIAERLAASDPGQTRWQRDLSVSHDRVGDVLLGQGDAPAALDEFRRAMATRERLAASDPGQAEWQRDLSVSHNRIGDVLRGQGDAPAALAEYRKSLAIRERLAANDPGQAEWQRDLSVSHNRIGDVLMGQGDAPGALAEYRKAMAIAERLAASDPWQTEWKRDLAITHNRIGDVLRAQGDAPAALAEYRIAMAIAERLAATAPGQAESQRDLSVSHNKIGDVLLAQGDASGALAEYREAMAIRERLAASDPAQAEWQRDLSISHNRIGDVLRGQGDAPGALAEYRKAMAIAERLAASDPGQAEWQRDLIVSLWRLADTDASGAVAHIARALAITRALADTGRLAPVDAWMIPELERRLRDLGAPPA